MIAPTKKWANPLKLPTLPLGVALFTEKWWNHTHKEALGPTTLAAISPIPYLQQCAMHKPSTGMGTWGLGMLSQPDVPFPGNVSPHKRHIRTCVLCIAVVL